MKDAPQMWETHPWVSEADRRIRFGIVHSLLGINLSWPELLRRVQEAEALGFDSYWFSDHPMRNPDCWTRIAALASTTKSIRLGSMVSCVYYRHPALLARIVADVDRMSEGRVVLGLGMGDYASEFEQMGLAFPPIAVRQAALDEALRIVRGLWTGEPFTYEGAHFRVADASVQPPPVQRPRVPILVAGAGERVTLGQVALHADASNFGPNPHTGNVLTPDVAAGKLAILRDHCERLGRPFRSVLRTHWSPPVVLAETLHDLAGKRKAISADEHRYYGEHMLVGTPDDAVVHFQRLIDAGMQYFIVHTRADVDTARLLAERVLPRLSIAPSFHASA